MTAAAPAPGGLAAELAGFAHGLRRESLGAGAARHTALLLLDAAGCALAGWQGEETPQVLAAAARLAGPGDTTVIGSPTAAAPLPAVLANAYLTTAVTACDVYTPAHCHLTPEVVPAALAIAEAQHASGAQLLTAVAAGLEVAGRLLRAIDYREFRRRGWHSPGVVGPVGAAVAAGRLLGLDAGRLRSAMSLAVSQAAGTFASWPTAAVKFHQSRGAASGLIAALLAAEGFESSREPFEAADGGLLSSYAPADPAAVLAGLGSSWELEQISLRLWPGATPVQAVLTALLAGGHQLPPPATISRVEIGVPPGTHAAHADLAHPAGSFQALLSFHFVAAASIIHGRFGFDLTRPPQLGGPELTAFIDQRIRFVADPDVPRGGARVTLTTRDGSTTVIRQHDALGTPRLPAGADQIEAKFLSAARPRLGPAAAGALLGCLRELDGVSDCADLLRLARPAAAAPRTPGPAQA